MAKIEVIENLPPPFTMKGIRSFLSYAGFYRRFIKSFSKITKSLCNLLEKEGTFKFVTDCLQAFEDLKAKLVYAPIVISLDWSLPFKIMYDASDHAKF